MILPSAQYRSNDMAVIVFLARVKRSLIFQQYRFLGLQTITLSIIKRVGFLF